MINMRKEGKLITLQLPRDGSKAAKERDKENASDFTHSFSERSLK